MSSREWAVMRRASLRRARRIYDEKINPLVFKDVREAFEVGWQAAEEKQKPKRKKA